MSFNLPDNVTPRDIDDAAEDRYGDEDPDEDQY